jgi:hypothetical protein
VVIRAQLSTGKAAAEAFPPHGYVVSRNGITGAKVPGD